MRYRVIESRAWQATDGRLASIYGAAPWTSDADKPNWSIVVRGWTVEDLRGGRIGIGRMPWIERGEAQAWCDTENAKPWNVAWSARR